MKTVTFRVDDNVDEPLFWLLGNFAWNFGVMIEGEKYAYSRRGTDRGRS
uniref:Uncharacterized protein n=1 Tax=Candidatus Kentrum sp. TUN TaxID=2126343 RepID=A0A450ZXB0_9GAMM|nr:MAG: hypothetical protein BECKTUN1418F_GA0071002_112310 [Candidatus Kentron sp. TUN]VFK58376.1 MAG: hypothetical protein BECKTUN1418D_GA0071000_10822 [Candidatus Kentron sp. TUN]VFK65992.1 MAG: hypothetical protein BECKTUN1418E_GA0071001_111810 [Candidatus Kentron sp. TUN]